ncbi:hypothetical protein E1193_19430 [Micromonospora sp. KC606]|uniref:hypothetical protein n=1 Tax=Micromonospora sp. KC606 TaxID=2530379 RepID=UPI001050E583|nr:hypothetical protein [Micromonospora sp. KC606]TDC79233.1 hypothetical protein E1193_19430 [Micromonospora sp. KC606]
MSDNDIRIGAGFPLSQLARALTTAGTHEDAAGRQRGELRVRRWQQVVDGMAGGGLDIGSRIPVRGLPAWVTPEVVHGGFATGEPAAGGPLRPDETDRAQRLGLPAERRALFWSWLTDAGLAELGELLDSGRYRVEYAEEAALPVVAWLLRAGDRDGALGVLEEIAPFADRLRFTPAPSDQRAGDPDVVYRQTAGDARQILEQRQPNAQIKTMREALTVWNPFADELLTLWCETRNGGRIGAVTPDGWLPRAVQLLARYQHLAAEHTLCSKHRNPKGSIGVLRTALERRVAGAELTPRERGLVQSVVDAMLRKRGHPGSPEHTAIRRLQAREAARPRHHQLAQLVAARLAGLPQDIGISDVDHVLRPVDADEAHPAGVVAGWPTPCPVARVVARAAAGTLEQLIDRGVIASAEELARLTPRLAAATAASAYPDPALRILMDATYRAFRNRRSLLLLNLEHQVRVAELPWVQAVASARVDTSDTRDQACRALVRLASAAVWGFPATVLPNPLVGELSTLSTLSKQASLQLPWVEELAADIFMGRFSAKFLQAAKLAGRRLAGSLYARYYDIDYSAIAAIDDTSRRLLRCTRTSDAFDQLCRERAGARGKRSWFNVAANGIIIEQAQILTTHNLATIAELGIDLPSADLARRCMDTVLRLATRIHHNPRPLGTVKNTAYAWRQMLFFLSLSTWEEQTAFPAYAEQRLATQPDHVRARIAPAVTGLAHVISGGKFDADGRAGTGRRLLGWTTREHWMVGPGPRD